MLASGRVDLQLFQQLSDLFALSKFRQDDLDEFILMWLLEPALRTCWHSVPASALVRNQVAGTQGKEFVDVEGWIKTDNWFVT